MPSQYKGSKVGFPIRRFLDQSSFAAPQDFSQRTTSFIASQRQGIHQMLLRHLITLMIDVRSAKTGHDLKKDLSSDFSKDDFCLPSISGTTAAGRRWFAGPRGPACRICCLFTISNIRAHPQRGEANSFDFRIQGNWWSLSGSNRRPEACKATALPTELWPPLAKPRSF